MARPRAFDEDDVLQKALETFWTQGYGATSVEDLVAATGLNKSSLYATFGDKHQLFLQALRHYHETGTRSLAALTADPALPVLAQLRRILEWTAQQVGGDLVPRGCMLVNATTELLPHDSEAQAIARQNQTFLETLLTDLLTRGQERGEVRPTATPQAQARLLMSVLNGMPVMVKTNPVPTLLPDVVSAVLRALEQDTAPNSRVQPVDSQQP